MALSSARALIFSHLLELAHRGEETYALEVVKDLRLQGNLVYKVVNQLSDSGRLKQRWDIDNRRRRMFRLNVRGMAFVAQQLRAYHEANKHVARVVSDVMEEGYERHELNGGDAEPSAHSGDHSLRDGKPAGRSLREGNHPLPEGEPQEGYRVLLDDGGRIE